MRSYRFLSNHAVTTTVDINKIWKFKVPEPSDWPTQRTQKFENFTHILKKFRSRWSFDEVGRLVCRSVWSIKGFICPETLINSHALAQSKFAGVVKCYKKAACDNHASSYRLTENQTTALKWVRLNNTGEMTKSRQNNETIQLKSTKHNEVRIYSCHRLVTRGVDADTTAW